MGGDAAAASHSIRWHMYRHSPNNACQCAQADDVFVARMAADEITAGSLTNGVP